jgi:hypothetical protein
MKTITIPLDEYNELIFKAQPYINAENEIDSLNKFNASLIKEKIFLNQRLDNEKDTLNYAMNRCKILEEQIEEFNKLKWYNLLFGNNKSI